MSDNCPGKSPLDSLAENIRLNQEYISNIKGPFKEIEKQKMFLSDFINQVTAPYYEFKNLLPESLTAPMEKVISRIKDLPLDDIPAPEDLQIESINPKQLNSKGKFKKYVINTLAAFMGVLQFIINNVDINININVNPSICEEILTAVNDLKNEINKINFEEESTEATFITD